MLLPKNLKKFAQFIVKYSDVYAEEKLGEMVELLYLHLDKQNDRDLREEINKKQHH